jgi:hypothetical protein
LIVRNAVIRDPRLSLRATGLLVRVLSRPDDWRIDRDSLASECKEGQAAVRSALAELEAAGYLVRMRRQDARGRWVTESVLYDTPQVVPVVGKPTVGNPPSVPPAETPQNPSSHRRLENRPSVFRPVIEELDLKKQEEKPPPAPAPTPDPTPSPSPQEEGDASQQETPNPAAAELVSPHVAALSTVERARLTTVVAKALAAGHSPDAVRAELAKSTGGLASVAAGLISRMRALAATAPVAEAAPLPAVDMDAWNRAAREAAPCPHGQPGGDLPRPTTGTPACPMCRQSAAAPVVVDEAPAVAPGAVLAVLAELRARMAADTAARHAAEEAAAARREALMSEWAA